MRHIFIIVVLLLAGGYLLDTSRPTSRVLEADDFLVDPPPYLIDSNIPDHSSDIKKVEFEYREPQHIEDIIFESFTTEDGISFVYPNSWHVTGRGNGGDDYRVLARVVNPDRAGRPDTDIPIEQLLIRRMTGACADPLDTGWGPDFFAPGILYRAICVPGDGSSLDIDASAFDENSRLIMERILVSISPPVFGNQ